VDVYEYACSLERTCREQSVAAERLDVKPDADGKRAKVEARLALDDEVFVEVHEVIEVDQGAIQPRRYSYCLVEHGMKRWSYDLDPRHAPEAHVHREGPLEREPSGVVTLPQVLNKAWESHSQAAESEGVFVSPRGRPRS
jgi:hypothetical protein